MDGHHHSSAVWELPAVPVTWPVTCLCHSIYVSANSIEKFANLDSWFDSRRLQFGLFCKWVRSFSTRAHTHSGTHWSVPVGTRARSKRCMTQARHTDTHVHAQRAHTVPVHLTKPLASWKRLIWAPAAPNHPIRARVISTLLSLSEPSVQVPLLLRRWQDGVVFRSSCLSLWAHPEGLSLVWTCLDHCEKRTDHFQAITYFVCYIFL